MNDAQRAYVDEVMANAQAGERTVVATDNGSFEGKRTDWTLVQRPQGEFPPFVVRFTITADDGTTLSHDEWPPGAEIEDQ